MAIQQQLSIIKQGAHVWNKWREEHPDIPVDLSQADLSGINPIEPFAGVRYPAYQRANLGGIALAGANLKEAKLYRADLAGADFSGADLQGADLSEAYLKGADLRKANLTGTRLGEADLRGANLTGARLREADLREATLVSAHLIGANLTNAHLRQADLMQADLVLSDLRGADLSKAHLRNADFRKADLRGANLSGAILVGAKIDKARLSGSTIFALSPAEIEGEFEEQHDLIITPYGSAAITVDNLQVARLLQLLLNSAEVRRTVALAATRLVLVLGSFADPDRRLILEAMRQLIREHNLLPVWFDFEHAAERDLAGAVPTLARLAYFVIIDLTNPRSSPLALEAHLDMDQAPILPILQEGESSLPEILNLSNRAMETILYASAEALIATLKATAFDRAIQKRNELALAQAREPRIHTVQDLLTK